MELRALVAAALDEDIGPGDVTSESLLPLDLAGEGEVLAKQELVVCGHAAATEVFRQVGEPCGAPVRYEVVVQDGERVVKGTVIAQLSGAYRPMLTGERVALNFLMRLSGIATHVGAYVLAAGPNGPAILDTRKTTPLLRTLEK